MKWLPVLLLPVLLCGCAGTTWEKVARTSTIEEAHEQLGSYAPEVVNYGKGHVAWYFGTLHCVLFVDGKTKLVKSLPRQVNQVHDTPFFKEERVSCDPKTLPE